MTFSTPLIPGHSPVTDWSAFKDYGEFLHAFVAAVEQARKDGKTVDQAAADLKLPGQFKDYKLAAARGAVTAIYSELK